MEPPSSSSIAIINESGRRAPRSLICRAVSTALTLHGQNGGAVSILLASDEGVRVLNRRFRGVDEATDVLTFPSGDFPGAILGDIAIAVPFAERQARSRGVSLSQELAFLAIHGTLHLLGFDDETESDRRRMIAEMNRVAIASGLPADESWSSLPHGAGMECCVR